MNIRPSAAIRQNYNEIAELCRKADALLMGFLKAIGNYTYFHINTAF